MLEQGRTGAMAVDYLDLVHLADREWEQKEKGKERERISQEHFGEGKEKKMGGLRAGKKYGRGYLEEMDLYCKGTVTGVALVLPRHAC